MHTRIWQRCRWLFAALALALLAQQAGAADFTAGLDTSSGSTRLWFKSNVNTSWVNAHYNIDGGGQQNVAMAWNAGAARFETAVAATGGQTVNYAFTYDNGGPAYDSAWASAVVGAGPPPNKVATPTFSPPGGSYASAQNVTVATTTAGASILCSINGGPQAPCANPIAVSASTTISAVASASGMTDSDPAAASYTIGGGSGPFNQGVTDNGSSVVIWLQPNTSISWVDAHYNVNSTGQQNVRMTQAGSQFQVTVPATAGAPLSIAYSFTYALPTGAQDSAAYTWTRGGGTVAAPSISPAGGAVAAPPTITLASATTGAEIHYTLDGSTPTTASPLYSGPFTAGAPGTTLIVQAMAAKAGLSSSGVTSASYQIAAQRAATPVFAPAGGTYASAQTVSLTSATSGASILYSVNGGAAQAYTAPFTVASNASISAWATKAGMSDSAPATASYTIGACTECFGYGVAENGATALVWFAPSWTPTTAIAHYYVTSATGAKGPQHDDAMTYNVALQRWEQPAAFMVSAGDTVSYFFTYSAPTGGNKDSPWYSYKICADGSSSADCPSQVPKPLVSPAGGVYPTAQNVTLALDPAAPADSAIYYTLDGSAPTTQSRRYAGEAISIATAATVNAITVQTNKLQSRIASATYDIQPPCDQTAQGCTIAAPTFSHASGTYGTRIGVNLLTQTVGATIHYTTDGSTPTAASPQFYGAIWIDTRSGTTTIKALATKDGQDSAVTSRTYTVTADAGTPWNGQTTFTIENGTAGAYADDQVYWLILGKDWDTHQYVHVDASGHLVPMSLGDNTIPVPNRTTGYANYAVTLAQAKSITIPALESARIYLSVGKPVLIQVNTNDKGELAYAGPDLNNSTDPNLGVTFDFGEFNINRANTANPGIYVNTSRVDIFGLPLKLNVKGLDGYEATVGEPLTETRAELFARFALEVPPEFRGLAQAPYAPQRIMSPAHASFDDGINVATGAQDRPRGANAAYLDDYITAVWNQYKSQNLVVDLHNGWPVLTGRVDGSDVMTFTDSAGSYRIHGKPTTTEVMLGNGLLDDASGTADKLSHDKQLQLQAQVCAALNRHVAEQPFTRWWDGAWFYPAGAPANYFTKFWHRHSYNGLAYGFSYDDVGGHSPSIYTPSPTTVTFTIGK
ncbi:MAG: beta-1,3-glucanase family protein [Telluria sp.]